MQFLTISLYFRTYETTPFKLIENNSNLTQSRLDPQDEGVKLFSTSRKFIKEASYDGVERKKVGIIHTFQFV